MASLQTTLDELVAILTPVAPVSLGKRQKGVNVDLPHYWIFLLREGFTGPQGAGGAGNPRALHTGAVSLEIHCWGLDYAAADYLKLAAITALRRVLLGANYRLDGGTWIDGVNDDRGVVYVLAFSIITAIPEVTLTNPAVDATQATVTPTAFAFDASTSVQGDGKLDADEPT